ncbi:hypothetical protein FI667_g13203, partial [Globisporangium splendens]
MKDATADGDGDDRAPAGEYAQVLDVMSGASMTHSMRIRLHKARSNGCLDEVIEGKPDKADADKYKKKRLRDKTPGAFKTNARLAARLALGVLLAGAVQTHASSNSEGKRWLLLPHDYYLGGLAYAAIMVIFAAARNVGGGIQNMWQIDLGVAIALVYNFVLFSCIPMTQSDLVDMHVNLRGRSYDISLHDFGVVLPLLVVFTFVMFVLPVRKDLGDGLFGTKNLIKNLAIYSGVGALGTAIALMTVLLPYPILATRQMISLIKAAPHDIRDILNLIVDSYCFRAKDIKQMDFFRLRLDRLLSSAQKRLTEMEGLLDECWWEELIGVGMYFKFNKTVAKQFVKLYAQLLKDVQAMRFAIAAETSHWTHAVLIKKLQKNIYVVQTEMNDLLEDISDKVLRADISMPSSRFNHLEMKLEQLMAKYTKLYGEIAASEVHTPADVGKTMPLNLFIYSFHALAHTLFEFEQQYNQKNFTSKYRIHSFVKMAWKSFYEKSSYPHQLLFFSFRTTLAVLLGVSVATFVFAFSYTAPNAIALVAQYHIGGTYSNTIYRFAGLVAGTVLPSVFHFFICQIPSDVGYNFLNNIILFVWTLGSMYLYYSASYQKIAGLVSAYMAAYVLLDHTCRSPTSITGSTGTLSYSNLTENALGILILMLVELILYPQSATTLLRKNIQDVVKQHGEVFRQVFRHHLASEQFQGATSHADKLTESELKALRKRVSVTLPLLLVEQAKLLHDASKEPTLWRPEFSVTKYSQVTNVCKTLLTHLRILLDLVEWHEKRRTNGLDTRLRLPRTSTLNAECFAAAVAVGDEPEAPSPRANASNPRQQWLASQDEFEASVEDALDTLTELFGKEFCNVSGDETAIFMQMKEAFRIADVHRRGEVNAGELALFLEKLLPYTALGNVEIDQYVGEFMKMVDKDQDGTVSFKEFMKALNEGFRLELEIYELAQARSLSGRAADGQLSRVDSSKRLNRADSRRLSRVDSRRGPQRAASVAVETVEKGTDAITPVFATSYPTATSSEDKPLTILDPNFFSVPEKQPTLRRRFSMEDSGEALLNVESFTIKKAYVALKQSYGEYFMYQYEREHQVPMEDFIVMSCLISECEQIEANLTELNSLAVS